MRGRELRRRVEILRVGLSAENGDPCLGIIHSKCRIPARPVVQQSNAYLPSAVTFSLQVIRKGFNSVSALREGTLGLLQGSGLECHWLWSLDI